MQQETAAIPHGWQGWAQIFVAAILGYFATYLPALLRRTQTVADVEKTKAETRSIDLNTTIHAGDILLGLIKEVATATGNVERLKTEKEFWQNKAERLGTEKELIERQLDEQIRIGRPKSLQ